MSEVLSTPLSIWPADTSVPVDELSTGDLLRRAVARTPHAVALREVAPEGANLTGADATDRVWTYAELLADAEACARWLLARFDPGDRVVVWAPNVPEWVVLQYGCALAGVILATANPALRAGELRYVLEQSGARGLVHTRAFRGSDMDAIGDEASAGLDGLVRVRFDEWPAVLAEGRASDRELPEVAPGDPAQIQYTSGTTGFPKGALLTHRGLVTNAHYVALRAGLGEGGCYLNTMPLFHTAGCALAVLSCGYRGAEMVLVQLFDPALVLEAVERHKVDSFLGVPTMLIALLDHPARPTTDLSSVRAVLSGGAMVQPELVHRVEEAFGAAFTIVYGQTELSPVVTQTDPSDSVEDKSCTVGRPLWNAEVRIAGPDGATVPVGVQGDICTRGYQVMNGYFRMPEKTAETIDADGWLHSGDLGTMDERGYVRITGRVKDMIIRGGENMFPAEIEQVLFAHPDVADVGVVGVPDDYWGERIVAVIRAADPAAPPAAADLHAWCRKELAPAKAPAEWFVTDAFPLTGSGKLQKFRIRELLAEGAYQRLD